MPNELRKMTRAELLSLLIEERKKNEEKDQKNRTLTIQSEEKDQQIKELNDRILSMQEQGADDTLKLNKMEESQEVLKTQLETCKIKQDELSEKNDRLRISLNEAVAENKKIREDLRISEKGVSDRANQIASLQRLSAQLKEDLQKKDNKIKRIEEELEDLKHDKVELTAENFALTGRVKEADEKMGILIREKQGLMDTVKALEAEKESLTTQQEKFDEGIIEELRRTIDDERAKNIELINEIDKLKELLNNIEAPVSEDDEPKNIVEQMKTELFEQSSSFQLRDSLQSGEGSSAKKIEDPDIVSEASEKVSSIIKMAQQRAEQYLNEAKEESERQIRECNQMKAETLDKCRSLEKDKQRACESMIANVKQETDAVLNELYKRTRGISRSQDSLYQELLEKIIGLDVF